MDDMTPTIARQIQTSPGYTQEERRLARLWLRQRQLFPGDGDLLADETGRLTVTIGEVIAWRRGLSA